MKPIETRYNGRLFRSRLEARWAVFLDTLGVRYDYEPEGFQFETATGPVFYLPDFWLPDFAAWVETKAVPPTPEERRKAALLAAGSGGRVYLLHGQFPDIRCVLFNGWPDGFVEEQDDYDWTGREFLSAYLLEDAMAEAGEAQFEHGRSGRSDFTRVADVLATGTGPLATVRRATELRERAQPRQEGTEIA